MLNKFLGLFKVQIKKQKSKTKLIFALLLFIFLIGFLFYGAGAFVFAQDFAGVEPLGETGLGQEDVRLIVARVIRIILGFLGIIALLVVLYGGYLWMTAAGDADKINQAKSVLINGAIGLVIILAAFSITSFLITRFQEATTGEFEAPGGAPPFYGGLAGGVIDSHYPERNAVNVPRNTKIIITFADQIEIGSLVDQNDTPEDASDDKLLTDRINIRQTEDDPQTGPFVADVNIAYTTDQRTFVLDPVNLLGSASENISYTIVITNNINNIAGQPIFGGLGFYDWSFEVSTLVDNTPPQVESVVPVLDSENPRNVIVQINFTEAIDPTTASGNTENGFNKIVLQNLTDNLNIEGLFTVSNQYRTVEFRTFDKCGENSCGDDVFCLPGNKQIQPTVKAASLSQAGEAQFPYDGVVDVAGNSLDGNANNISDGQPADNYSWQFLTTDLIDLEPPRILSTAPENLSSQVALDSPITATFSKFISASTANSRNFVIEGLSYWVTMFNDYENQTSTLSANHDLLEEDSDYAPELNSGIKDLYQNCYFPCSGPLPLP